MMFLICYGPGNATDTNTQAALDAGIKSLGNWSNRIENQWFLECNMNAANIRDRLKQFLNDEAGDKLFVARMSKNWAGRNMGAGFPEWLKRRNFGTFTTTTTH